MKTSAKMFLLLALAFGGLTATAETKYIVTNDDNPSGNSASIFSATSSGTLTLVKTIPTGGYGIGGGYFAASRANVLRSKANNCTYVGDVYGKNMSLPSDVAAIDMSTLTLVGAFPGFQLDSGAIWGISLAEDSSGAYLFAAFSQSGTITTYKQEAGCQLKKLNQTITFGALNSPVGGMKVTPNGKFLIVSYEDTSIGSFDIDSDTGSLTLINRFLVADSEIATSIDITSDSRWVVFGDADPNNVPVVEVAPIHENGSLGPTQDYAGIGTGLGSENVWLSPDESQLYISNNFSGQVTAVPFNKEHGIVDVPLACTSAVLKGFGFWTNLGSIVGNSIAENGSPVFAAEFGSKPAGIAIVDFIKPCTLIEDSASPASDPASNSLLSIGADPPRSF
jgi:hypothetical protein